MQSTEAPKYTPRTLDYVEREMVGFSHDQIQFVYHTINGRRELAESYLESIKAESQACKQELVFVNPETGMIDRPPTPPLEEPTKPDESLIEIKM